jgi:hypothetical protein
MMFSGYLNISEFLANKITVHNLPNFFLEGWVPVLSIHLRTTSSFCKIINRHSVLDRDLIYTFSGLYGKK